MSPRSRSHDVHANSSDGRVCLICCRSSRRRSRASPRCNEAHRSAKTSCGEYTLPPVCWRVILLIHPRCVNAMSHCFLCLQQVSAGERGAGHAGRGSVQRDRSTGTSSSEHATWPSPHYPAPLTSFICAVFAPAAARGQDRRGHELGRDVCAARDVGCDEGADRQHHAGAPEGLLHPPRGMQRLHGCICPQTPIRIDGES